MHSGLNMTLAASICWNWISIISNMGTMLYLQRSWLKAGRFGMPENRSPRTGAGFHPSGNLVVICAVSEKVMPMSWMTDFPFNIIMRRYIS